MIMRIEIEIKNKYRDQIKLQKNILKSQDSMSKTQKKQDTIKISIRQSRHKTQTTNDDKADKHDDNFE